MVPTDLHNASAVNIASNAFAHSFVQSHLNASRNARARVLILHVLVVLFKYQLPHYSSTSGGGVLSKNTIRIDAAP